MNTMNHRPQPPRRPAPKARGQSKVALSGGVLPLLVFGVLAVLLAYLLQSAWPNGFPLEIRGRTADETAATISEIYTEGPLRLNELSSRNRRSFVPAKDQSPDWIELMNVSDKAINLKGWSLAKNEKGIAVFTFPDMQLDAGECVLVAADDLLREDADKLLHAPFKLSSAGDTLMLFSPSGTAVDSVNIPALQADQSYIRQEHRSWGYCATPTPGQPNTQQGYDALRTPFANSPIIISEFMPHNTGAHQDEKNRVLDYIEVHNRSNETVELSGWGLTDDASEPCKWMFPSLSLEPGARILIYAVGKDVPLEAGSLDAGFSLRPEGEQLALTDPKGRLMDKVTYGPTRANVAWTRASDGTWTVDASPSPGA